MPNTLSALPSSIYKLSHDPTQSVMGDVGSDLTNNPFAAMTDEILFGAVNTLLQDIDAATGLDLLDFATGLESLLGGPLSLLTGFLGFVTPGTGTTGGGVFGPLLGLIPGLGGGTGTLGGLGTFLNPVSLIGAAAGIFQPILSGAGSFLGGLIPGLDASKIVSGSFPLSMITGLIDTGGQIVTSLLTVPLSVITGLLSGGTILGSLIPGLDASQITSGSFSLTQLPSTVLNSVVGVAGSLINSVLGLGVIPNLPASQTTSGTFTGSLIPGLDASKITSGIFTLAQLPTTVLNSVTGVASSLLSGVLGLGLIPNLPASQTTSGTFAGGLIPGLDASKITSGIFTLSQLPSTVLSTVSGVASSLLSGVLGLGLIPNLPASQTTSGTFGTSLIPGLDGSKITSGVVALANLPTSILTTVSGVASSLISGVLGLGNIPNLPASQTTSGTFGTSLIPGLDASVITSGVFGLTQLVSTVLNTVTGVAGSLVNSVVGGSVIPTLDGSKIGTGTVADARLSANVLTAGSTLDASKLKASFTPTITRANTTDIADTGQWLQRFTANLMKITSNVATPTTVNASSWSLITALTPMATNNHYAQATMSATAVSLETVAILLGSNNTEQFYLLLGQGSAAFLMKTGPNVAYTNFRTSGTVIKQTAAAVNWVATDVFRIERTGNVYTCKKNGVAITWSDSTTTWTDTNNTYPNLDYQHRDTGVAMQMVTAGHGITAFSSGDL